MARNLWVIFGVILAVTLAASLEVTAMEGGGGFVGEMAVEGTGGGDEGAGGETDGGVGRGVGGGDGGYHPDGRAMEEDEASRVGDNTDTEVTFPDLPNLSGKARAQQLQQVSIFEAFASSSHRGPTEEGGPSDPAEEEEEEAEGFNAEGSQYAKSEEREEAEESEVPVHHTTKRRRVFEDGRATGWSTLLGDGPLEGYCRCRTSMLRFRTICAGHISLGSLK